MILKVMTMGYALFETDVAASLEGPSPDLCARRLAPAASLTALEWSVVALARNDRVSTLHQPGRVAVAMGILFGPRRNPGLADARLEALRRIAVLLWHRGPTVQQDELNALMEAGFTPAQYQLLVASIGKCRTSSTADCRR
jgi:hypothetical protein